VKLGAIIGARTMEQWEIKVDHGQEGWIWGKEDQEEAQVRLGWGA